jgi:hypothetical protein
MLMQAIANTGFHVGIVADSYDNAQELLAKIKDYCAQLGIATTTENTRKIVLANGSSLSAITVNSGIGKENKAGRSKTYHALLLSECAYYRNSFAVFASLTSALIPGGQIIIESTATPQPTIFKHIWNSDLSEYTKVFYSCEVHPNYKDNPADIPDDVYQSLATRWGFTDRSTAAFWMRKLNVDFGGDIQKLLREFPVLPEHAWAAASGRWINVDPPLATVTGYLGDTTCFYPTSFGGHYIVGVDIASGTGRDSSAVLVWDLVHRRVVALWHSNTTQMDGLAAVIKSINAAYKPIAIVAERNGIGGGLPGYFTGLTLPMIYHTTTEATKYSSLLQVKRVLEAGACADQQFSTEAQQLTYDLVGEKERFSHAGDTLMALAMCLHYERQFEYVTTQPAPRPPVPEGHYDMDRALRKVEKRRRQDAARGIF